MGRYRFAFISASVDRENKGTDHFFFSLLLFSGDNDVQIDLVGAAFASMDSGAIKRIRFQLVCGADDGRLLETPNEFARDMRAHTKSKNRREYFRPGGTRAHFMTIFYHE